MTPDLDSLRAEFAQERVGPLLYVFLGQVVKVTVASYPPSIYSPSGAWDPATLTDVLHDWLEQRLLRGHLEVLLRTAGSIPSLRAQLHTSFSQLLINRRKRDSAANLYKRVLKLLTTEDVFESIDDASAAHRQWRLAGSELSEPAQMGLGELTAVAYRLDDDDLEVVRYGAHSLKSSPILREPQLLRFLCNLFEGADGTLDATRIAEVMQRRFSLHRHTLVELGEDLSSNEPAVDLHVGAADAVKAILAMLCKDDIDALEALFTNDLIVSRAAQALHCSEGRISGARGRLQREIAQYADSEPEAHEILRILSESLFQ